MPTHPSLTQTIATLTPLQSMLRFPMFETGISLTDSDYLDYFKKLEQFSHQHQWSCDRLTLVCSNDDAALDGLLMYLQTDCVALPFNALSLHLQTSVQIDEDLFFDRLKRLLILLSEQSLSVLIFEQNEVSISFVQRLTLWVMSNQDVALEIHLPKMVQDTMYQQPHRSPQINLENPRLTS